LARLPQKVPRVRIESLHAVDVDEVRRQREPQRHRRHQALAAGEHAAVLGRDARQGRDRVLDRPRCVILERRRFHE
jgi:hypothetical protein